MYLLRFRAAPAVHLLLVLLAVTSVHGSDTPAPEPDAFEVQIYLSRAGFSPGVLDGRWGDNTRSALRAFQRAHDLGVTGTADGATLEALDSESIEPTVERALTEVDVSGPFADVPDDMMEQAKLDHLRYESVEEKLAERFHTTPEKLRALNPDTSFEAGQTLRVPNVEPFHADRPLAPPEGVEENLDTAELTVRVWRGDSVLAVEDEAGRVRFWAPVTAGSKAFPLPIGTWTVRAIAPAPTYHYDPELFGDDAEADHAKTEVAAGPNNPVGTVWIDLDKEHYGLHGTPEPAKVGYASSHGCVRLTNWDAERLAAMVAPGTKVVFTE